MELKALLALNPVSAIFNILRIAVEHERHKPIQAVYGAEWKGKEAVTRQDGEWREFTTPDGRIGFERDVKDGWK